MAVGFLEIEAAGGVCGCEAAPVTPLVLRSLRAGQFKYVVVCFEEWEFVVP